MASRRRNAFSSSFRPRTATLFVSSIPLFHPERNVWVVKFPFSALGGFCAEARAPWDEKTGALEIGRRGGERRDNGRLKYLISQGPAGWKSGWSRSSLFPFVLPTLRPPFFPHLPSSRSASVLNAVWFISGKTRDARSTTAVAAASFSSFRDVASISSFLLFFFSPLSPPPPPSLAFSSRLSPFLFLETMLYNFPLESNLTVVDDCVSVGESDAVRARRNSSPKKRYIVSVVFFRTPSRISSN